MDPTRFDRLARSLAHPASRRRALGALLATVVAPASAAAAPAPAACLAVGKRCSQPTSAGAGHAKGPRKGKGKPPSCAKCCSRFGAAGTDGKARCTCKGEGVACDNASQCCSGQCKSGSCTGCPGTTVFCTDGCANLQTNNQHCGSCDVACAAGQRCVNGACVCDSPSCPNGCCANTTCKRGDSPSACGDGGAPCALCQTGEICNDGTCECVSGVICTGSGCCASADQVCDQNDVCCTPTTCAAGQCGHPSDTCGGTLNCGSCDASQCLTCGADNTCASTCSGTTPVCRGGTCVCSATSCPSGQTCSSNGSCQSPCLAEGQDCTTASDCCQTTSTSCDHSGTTIGEFLGPTRCCHGLGATCSVHLGCCARQTGEGMTGVDCSPAGVCGGPGAGCNVPAACASASCDVTTFRCN